MKTSLQCQQLYSGYQLLRLKTNYLQEGCLLDLAAKGSLGVIPDFYPRFACEEQGLALPTAMSEYAPVSMQGVCGNRSRLPTLAGIVKPYCGMILDDAHGKAHHVWSALMLQAFKFHIVKCQLHA